MKKSKKIIKRGAQLLTIFLIVITLNVLNILNSVQASNINEANIYSAGDCGSLLKYKGIVVKAYYAEYKNNGITYPAYCLDKTLQGVNNDISYSVNIEKAITDVNLWRYIINGYPYKSYRELGCANKEEAFTATKQAIYCYIHGNNPQDYSPIGDAGVRTLNALKKIVSEAQNSKEIQISNTLTINKNISNWIQDNIDKNYLSKTYTVSANTSIDKYKITISNGEKELPEGIKLTDEKNKEKNEFNSNEKFKILIPIKNLRKSGDFNLKAEAKIKTKPVLYGKSSNTSYQDYALTAATYEDGIGNVKDEYIQNKTQIIVKKVDKDSKENLENVEFNLLDKNKEIVHANLKTNKEGKITIENLIPGTYFLKETKANDGYITYDELIEIKIKLNETVTVTVNNTKEEKTKITIEEKEQEVETQNKKDITTEQEIQKEIIVEQEIRNEKVIKQTKQTETRKLPVTGM